MVIIVHGGTEGDLLSCGQNEASLGRKVQILKQPVMLKPREEIIPYFSRHLFTSAFV